MVENMTGQKVTETRKIGYFKKSDKNKYCKVFI